MSRKLAALMAAFVLCLMSVAPATAVPRTAGADPAANPIASVPASPTDESKVPHYFGPYPNWANSPFTLPDATVTITGTGTGATAIATVGAGGAVTGITITNPGRGYATAEVAISGGDSNATAIPTVTTSGAVTSVTVDDGGAGYVSPVVTFTGGGASVQATATAYGGVDVVTLVDAGAGYTMPTVDFDMPDALDGTQARAHVNWDPDGTITGTAGSILDVVVDDPGSGYSVAPKVVIRDGTLFDPITPLPGSTFTPATASATLSISSVGLDTFGAGYTSEPTVTFSDAADGGAGDGAAGTATTDLGAITSISVTNPGSGYITGGGIEKFVDTLPGLGEAGANNLGQYLPVAVPDTTTFPDDPATPEPEGADYYVIAVVQHREQMHSDLPPTLVREYVQLSTDVVPGRQVALQTARLDGTTAPTLMPDGSQAYGVDDPHYLGPIIVAQKDRPVRITFYNLLPTGVDGDLFLPVDSTIMGSGMGPTEPMMDPMDEGSVMDDVRNPMCTDAQAMGDMCFVKNRATLHLHGGITPWISDGTPHQWITPANESTAWPQGVSVESVPDMVGAAAAAKGLPDCSAENDGCMTFYYTNQQSARFMFYHDHSWGITRLNVYAGEAAGYLITDPTEQALIDGDVIPEDQIPLVIQDRTFVPQAEQLAGQDPTWDYERWGGYGNFWYHHVYMPAQNPGDPSGMSGFGRWMYSPWFWPPAQAKYGPIANPYFNPSCDLDDPATWTYQEDPFCEPELIPGTPNISAGMEQFNDTPVINGTAYPTMTVEPKSYRLRILNAANDRFWNLQWYIGDETTASQNDNAAGDPIGPTEVALKAAEVAAAQTDPVVFPTPDTNLSPAGPDWIQIGTEGGFLPAPAVVDGQQHTTWITDPTRFDVGLVDQHSLVLAPAERADAIVDFSKFAGQTLILYNDAPAAYPARIPSYDYYTGAPDLSPVGAPSILPGYGPNTRTIMQVKVAGEPEAAFNLTKLRAEFRHQADGTGVFESGQHPIIVGQAGYNSAYGTSFASSGWCNAPGSTSTRCDGFARISEQGGETLGFNTLRAPNAKLSVLIEPKAIQDETSETAFDEFGRMSANLGLEQVPAQPGLQNNILFPYTGPTTELIDASALPTLSPGDMDVTPIASGADGTQIWKITHNGVDTHPIHFHLFDVQLVNRVTWDNIIKPPETTELGWKDTIRVSPLEDTIVALRPVIPWLPFDLPNSIRLLSPMMPEGMVIASASLAEQLGLAITSFAPNGDPIDVVNHYVNFGAEYVYHCHILSHEEMDMMRPVSVALRPRAPDGLSTAVVAVQGTNGTLRLTWNDTSLNETAFRVQRMQVGTGTWTDLATLAPELQAVNTTGPMSYDDTTYRTNRAYQYRVIAVNTVGDTWNYADPAINEIVSGGFPTVTLTAESEPVDSPPAAPSSLAAALQPGPTGSQPQVRLTWRDNATSETGFVVERQVNGGGFAPIGSAPAFAGTGTVSPPFVDADVAPGNTFQYRVAAVNTGGRSASSNTVTVVVPAVPVAPSSLTATSGANQGNQRRVVLGWIDNAVGETGFTIQRSTDPGFTPVTTTTAGANAQTVTIAGLGANTSYYFRIRANAGAAVWSDWVTATPFPILTNP
jgi:FtsP/CotA-like multicopper oxidase with cupredoxin domain